MRILFVVVLLWPVQSAFPSGHSPASQRPLSLYEAQGLAALQAPELAAQRAATDAARQAVTPAGQQPDPKLILGIESIPAEGADRFRLTRDFMTMRRIGLMQEVVDGDKRRLRTERAEADARREEAGMTQIETGVQREVALAWIDVHFALRQQQLLSLLEAELRLQVSAADAALAGGRAGTDEPFGARLMQAQLDERKLEAGRQLARARAGLSRWIGDAASRPLADAPDFGTTPFAGADWRAQVSRLPVLTQFNRMLEVARIDAQLARADSRPDWSWEIAYAQRGPDFVNMLSFSVRIDLPIFQSRRQTPRVAVKVAQQEQIRMRTEAVRREQVAQIESLLADWHAASQRVARYVTELMPLARERTAARLAAYRGAEGTLLPVVEARRAEIEIRLARLLAEQEQARAWAQLNFLLPTHPAKESS